MDPTWNDYGTTCSFLSFYDTVGGDTGIPDDLTSYGDDYPAYLITENRITPVIGSPTTGTYRVKSSTYYVGYGNIEYEGYETATFNMVYNGSGFTATSVVSCEQTAPTWYEDLFCSCDHDCLLNKFSGVISCNCDGSFIPSSAPQGADSWWDAYGCPNGVVTAAEGETWMCEVSTDEGYLNTRWGQIPNGMEASWGDEGVGPAPRGNGNVWGALKFSAADYGCMGYRKEEREQTWGYQVDGGVPWPLGEPPIPNAYNAIEYELLIN